MPSVELSKLQAVGPTRALAESDRAPATASRAAARDTAVAPAGHGISVEIDAPFDGSGPPVDAERVAQIREALRDGSYPLVPTRIVDAMIAAQVSFALPPQARNHE